MKKQNDSIEIGIYAACLADHYLAQLCVSSRMGYVPALEEISAWAHEFYAAYNKALQNWASFQTSSKNTYHSSSFEEFIAAWGRDRLTKFLANR